MDGITIARIIDSELASRGISKADFYTQSGVSSATLSQWRTGKYEPTADKISKVEKCLNISFADYEKSDPREGLREDLQTKGSSPVRVTKILGVESDCFLPHFFVFDNFSEQFAL